LRTNKELQNHNHTIIVFVPTLFKCSIFSYFRANTTSTCNMHHQLQEIGDRSKKACKRKAHAECTVNQAIGSFITFRARYHLPFAVSNKHG